MKTEDVIDNGLVACGRVVTGVGELTPILVGLLPIELAEFNELDLLQRTACVALLKRYEQLQDLTGRVMRAVVSWEQADTSPLTQRDLANWMERLRFVDDADRWIDLAFLRNRLVHEYPIEESEQVDRVNETWRTLPELIEIVNSIEHYWTEAKTA